MIINILPISNGKIFVRKTLIYLEHVFVCRYISVLVELTRLEGTKHGSLISLQLLDVAVRVESIREFACQQMAVLLDNAHMFILGSNSTNVAEVLYAAAWICGEFCSYVLRFVLIEVKMLTSVAVFFGRYLKDPDRTVQSMLNTKITAFPGHIQSVYYQNILKILTFILTNNESIAKEVLTISIEKMTAFLSSGDVEAQERVGIDICLFENLNKNKTKIRSRQM